MRMTVVIIFVVTNNVYDRKEEKDILENIILSLLKIKILAIDIKSVGYFSGLMNSQNTTLTNRTFSCLSLQS